MAEATAHELELALCEAYEQQRDRYLAAEATSRKIVAAYRAGEDAADELHRLQASLDDIAAINDQVGEARRQWDASGNKPGPRLGETMQQLERLVRQLLEQINEAEQLARAARDRLVPELNQEARTQQMRAAYATDA
ncbi:MAG: hypothetical protein KDA55_21405 [Planctomycetales bacterium]|nr:hypothetical protein [Planctomycetales bacterium]